MLCAFKLLNDDGLVTWKNNEIVHFRLFRGTRDNCTSSSNSMPFGVPFEHCRNECLPLPATVKNTLLDIFHVDSLTSQHS